MVFKAVFTVAFIWLLYLPFLNAPAPVPVVVVPTEVPPVVKITPVKPPVKVETYVPKHRVTLPDFAAIRSVTEKKAAFFDFLTPYVDAENKRLLDLNRWLVAVKKQFTEQYLLAPEDEKTLQQLYYSYRIDYQAMSTEKAISALIKCIDALPKTLVLMQAANESAWGSSRFARLGLNFFGEWCYVKDCGVIPNSRKGGLTHEVKAFETVEQGVRSYFKNINSNVAYALLRDIRAQFRANNLPLQADVLATGLIQYSSRGDHYVNEISQMIRYNERFMAE